jgi:hypothetical protein
MRNLVLMLAGLAGFVVTAPAFARSPGDPIRLVWSEGDIAGMTAIHGRDGGEAIGFVEYHQTRTADRLTCTRVARFRDGSSDEDSAEAKIGDTLQAISGRSIIRDKDGSVIVDMRIDVAGGRVQASWGPADARQQYDQPVALPAGTYWGPLVFLVLKNFAANAEGDKVVFRTVAPTPKPMVLDMELSRAGNAPLDRAGVRIEATMYRLQPTIHWMVDPIVRMIAPRATFFMLPGDPPALARFAGPRNYGRQPIVIE